MEHSRKTKKCLDKVCGFGKFSILNNVWIFPFCHRHKKAPIKSAFGVKQNYLQSYVFIIPLYYFCMYLQ